MARFDTGFELPDNRYIAPQPVAAPQEQGAVPFFNLPQENQELAYVEGLTDQYYDTRGKIEAYASDMWKKYGVDVTQPDYSQPGTGGGVPFKTYQKLATQLLMTANDLKISREQEKQEAPYRMSGAIKDVEGFDPQAQPINRVAAENRYFSTQLLPEVDAANKILEENVYTDADYKRFTDQVLKPTIANLRAKMLTPGISEGEKQQIQFNIDALVQKPKTTPYAAFQNASKKTTTVEIDTLKKVHNLAQGKWAKGSYTPSTDERGNPVLVNKAFDGVRAGEHAYDDGKGNPRKTDRIIDGIVKKSDGIYFTFKQGNGIEIPPVKVSSKRGDEVAKDIIESNPKFGTVTKMYEAMREAGYADESGSLKHDALLAGEEFDTPDPSTFGERIVAEKERIKKLMDQGTATDPAGNVFKNRPKINLVLPDGETATLVKHRVGDGWFLEGHDDNDNFTHMEWDEVEQWLGGEEKYFDQFLTEPAEQASPTPPPTAPPVAQDSTGTTPPVPGTSEPQPTVPSRASMIGAAQPAPTQTKPAFKVAGESGDKNIHPWSLGVGNFIAGLLGDVTFNSVHRTPERNKQVGGVDSSFHLEGAAIDMKPSDWKKLSAKERKQLLDIFGAVAIDEGDHIHIEPKDRTSLSKADSIRIRAAELMAKYAKQ